MYRCLWRIGLMGSLRSRITGERRGRRGVTFLTTILVGLGRLLTRYGFGEVGRSGNRIVLPRGDWVVASEHRVHWTRRFDGLTFGLRAVVRGVSTRVHCYSVEYIVGDAHRSRFSGYLSLFTVGIVTRVTAENLVQLYLGWEGVGVCSYRLINFWYSRRQANKSALKAMVVNRVGDWARSLGMCLRVALTGGIAYGERRARGSGGVASRRVGLRLFGGAVGKSAQRGLQVWLPDAMEGPTPVSALIHAATMVTAGVYRRLRLSPLSGSLEGRSEVIMVLGGRTARYAGTIGVVQSDRKRVIAYSTCSQLGYMICGCGREGYEVSFGHLVNHAIYKGRLFLGAGGVIHGLADEQDRRGMGGIIRRRPLTAGTIVLGSGALVGRPYLTGYYSKDVRLERAGASYSLVGERVYGRRILSGRCTIYYSIRRRYRAFYGEVGGSRQRFGVVHEAPLMMVRPLMFLTFGSVVGGWWTKERRLGRGTGYWGHSLMTAPDTLRRRDGEFRSRERKRRPLVGAGRLGFMTIWLYEVCGRGRVVIKLWGAGAYRFFAKKWWRDKVYGVMVTAVIRVPGHVRTFSGRDRGRYERRGGSGLSDRRMLFGQRGRGWHTGGRKSYMQSLLTVRILSVGLCWVW